MKVRHIRVDDLTWDHAKARARREGTTPSAVVREALAAYGGETADEELSRIIKRLNTINLSKRKTS